MNKINFPIKLAFLFFLVGVSCVKLNVLMDVVSNFRTASDSYISQIYADEVDDLQSQINELEHLRQLSADATKPLEQEFGSLEKRINNARYSIQVAKNEAEALAIKIEEREIDLTFQYQIFSKRIAQQYKRIRTFSPIITVLASDNAADLTKDLAYRDSVKNHDNQFIKAIGEDIRGLQNDKKKLESDQVTLAALEKQLDEQASFFKIEIDKAKDYQQDLSGKIASLTAKQKAIISARSGSYTTSAGDVPIGSDYDASIAGFQDNAPGGYFAVFSFGAYTHRKGMSQYGANARAKDGQDYKQILRDYYGKEPVSKDTGGNISVSGFGTLNFEEYYLYGIAEMPSSWEKEALKAQAVAARTYAYRYKIDGSTICTTEACQVFSNSKAASPPQAWRDAVNETRGMILEDVVTYYSSTSGGYLSTSGWDTTDKSGSGSWTSRAWESIGDSPWFYKAWYRQGYTNSSNSCGRKPWMSEEEMADILNAYLLRQNSGGADMDRLLPTTIGSCAIGGQSGNPYSMSELRGFVDNPVTSIGGSPTVSHNDSGTTTQVRFSTNRGDISMSGSEFKEIFNTRAPGYISIPQSSFSFFNIERK
jgi:peptidoglycan hydrolase CwlO-like protein